MGRGGAGSVSREFIVFDSLLNRVRGLLQVRKDRASPPRGTKPRIGAHIICGDIRMMTQAGMSDELWHWLLELGWRESIYRPDRRAYHDIPASWITRLIDAQPELRAQVLATAIAKAEQRPARCNLEPPPPSYLKRG